METEGSLPCSVKEFLPHEVQSELSLIDLEVFSCRTSSFPASYLV